MPLLIKLPPLDSLPDAAAAEDGLSPSAPVALAVGDHFKKSGRRVIAWRIDAISHPPRVGPMVTLAEIDGTARVQIRASDVFIMGFHRVGGLAARP